MPSWVLSLDQDTIWKVATYEMSFAHGSIRTVDGGISDDEGDQFNDRTHILPGIAGTQADYDRGQSLYNYTVPSATVLTATGTDRLRLRRREAISDPNQPISRKVARTLLTTVAGYGK